MENLKIVKLGYRIDLNKIKDNYFISDEITTATSKTEAKSILFDKIKYEDYKINHTDEVITLKNIPVTRAKEYDVVLFEGKEVVRYTIELIYQERKRNEELAKILNNPDIKYCYIKKGGTYYRPNSAGYTDYKTKAGIYEKEDAIDSAKRCDELQIIPINIEEHNQTILSEIEELGKQLIGLAITTAIPTPITTTVVKQ